VLLDLPLQDHVLVLLDPPGRRRATPGWREAAAAAREPGRAFAPVVEDCHWIDSDSQALLDELVESLQQAGCCCWLTYLPEKKYRHGWGNRARTSSSGSTRLTTSSADYLLRSAEECGDRGASSAMLKV